jgi:hypothetical protein
MATTDYRVFTATIASATTTSSEIDLEKAYQRVYLKIPSTSVGNTRIFGTTESGGTYVAVAASAGTSVDIASSISGKLVEVGQYTRFLKVIASTAPANGGIYKLVCMS